MTSLTTGTKVDRLRSVKLEIQGELASDGSGVKLTRFMGTRALMMLDPFLLFDMIYSDEPRDYLGGFPDHPHRGFETVSYSLAGRIRHEDNKGHAGVIEPGGVQWMTAGRGIVHSEIPEQIDGLLWGFQLWINLPAVDKMTEPRYQEFPSSRIPVEHQANGTQIRVIAGQTSLGTTGPIQPGATEPIYLDVAIASSRRDSASAEAKPIAPGNDFSQIIPATHNAFIFVYDGNITIVGNLAQQQIVKAGTLAVLSEGDHLQICTQNTIGKFLLIAGKPLNEPVAHGGPFVMNTKAEVLQAYQDYSAGRF